jgi:hypothetical protein
VAAGPVRQDLAVQQDRAALAAAAALRLASFPTSICCRFGAAHVRNTTAQQMDVPLAYVPAGRNTTTCAGSLGSTQRVFELHYYGVQHTVRADGLRYVA